jgi:uncharacterized hydrophobic protein (TIGR00271 family)
MPWKWSRSELLALVDHAEVLARVHGEAGWSHRYAFMVLMSAGIAILGLLLSSPAVIIGAMLISPLMGPIIGLGFALATFEWREARRSLLAVAAGTLIAIAFTALVVLASPLKDLTPEILARTRPNLFDLLVAVFSALAGTYATIRGRGETIVGVAIATALMPPLAVVGFGAATANMGVFGGALALFLTNFIAITLSATLVARVYGFGSNLSPVQTRQQAFALILVFAALAVPLALALRQIAWETWTTQAVRSDIGREFGPGARIGTLEPDFGSEKPRFRATIFTDNYRAMAAADIEQRLSARLARPVEVELSQILVNQDIARADLDRARAAVDREAGIVAARQDIAARLMQATGLPPEAFTIDAFARRATVRLGGLRPLADWKATEARLALDSPGWQIQLMPTALPLPPLRFAAGSASLDPADLDTLVWALDRMGAGQVKLTARRVSGEPASLAGARADAVEQALKAAGIIVVKAPPLAVDRDLEREAGLAAAREVLVSVVPAAPAEPTAPEALGKG